MYPMEYSEVTIQRNEATRANRYPSGSTSRTRGIPGMGVDQGEVGPSPGHDLGPEGEDNAEKDDPRGERRRLPEVRPVPNRPMKRVPTRGSRTARRAVVPRTGHREELDSVHEATPRSISAARVAIPAVSVALMPK